MIAFSAQRTHQPGPRIFVADLGQSGRNERPEAHVGEPAQERTDGVLRPDLPERCQDLQVFFVGASTAGREPPSDQLFLARIVSGEPERERSQPPHARLCTMEQLEDQWGSLAEAREIEGQPRAHLGIVLTPEREPKRRRFLVRGQAEEHLGCLRPDPAVGVLEELRKLRRRVRFASESADDGRRPALALVTQSLGLEPSMRSREGAGASAHVLEAPRVLLAHVPFLARVLREVEQATSASTDDGKSDEKCLPPGATARPSRPGPDLPPARYPSYRSAPCPNRDRAGAAARGSSCWRAPSAEGRSSAREPPHDAPQAHRARQ